MKKYDEIEPENIGKIYEETLEKDTRKSGGIYYTPPYIVDYIVKNTVGKWVKGSTLENVTKMTIVDTACGAGIFLLGAYQFLLDWHKRYRKRELTFDERTRILKNNIYGVDIDPFAVKLTKYALRRKCSKGFTREREQPLLDDNICVGNSIIDTDIYDSGNFGDERKIKPFNWQRAFPEVFKQGGFDCVIGNPPYVKEYTSRKTFEQVRKSHLAKYYQGKMDLWYFFICYEIDILNPNGLLGLIVPNNWTTNAGASILRNKILSDSTIQNIVDFGGYLVFSNSSIQTMILLLQKRRQEMYSFDYRKMNAIKPNFALAEKLLAKEPELGLTYLQPEISVQNRLNR
jgi:adenine-specific DNA-methyltransferase